MTSGFLLINKPPGPTSHDIIDVVRRMTDVRTVGHAGTLDPFAQGLLIVGVGREATKQLDRFKALPKTYIATLQLGATSDTGDRMGRIKNNESGITNLSENIIQEILKKFEGEIEQVPPMYSAKKVRGIKLYELARQGQTIERTPTKVTIYSIQLVPERSASVVEGLPRGQKTLRQVQGIKNLPTITLEVRCSPGTYIRALARDIGDAIGCGAYLEELMRITVGPYKLENAVPLSELTPNNWHEHLLTFSNDELGIKNKESLIPNSKFVIRDSSPKPLRVLVFGTFDLFHPGHKDFFRQARELGDYLIVGVGRDAVVAAIKGRPPRQNERERRDAVQRSDLVDEALLLPENPDDRFEWIKIIKPDVIALGYDQTAFTKDLAHHLKANRLTCRIVRLKPFQPETYKSSIRA